ncbi:MAG: hypothetical protein V1701_01645 [Planctomycetota bacterium]
MPLKRLIYLSVILTFIGGVALLCGWTDSVRDKATVNNGFVFNSRYSISSGSISVSESGTANGENTTPNNPKKASVSTELSPENLRNLQFIVSRLRDLEFKNSVAVDNKTRDTLKIKMLEDFEKSSNPAETAKIKKTLVKFGLVPPDINLDKFMADLYTEQIAGYYDAEAKELYTISPGSADKVEPQKEIFGVPWERLTVIHEMTHALQDQHFDLLSLPMDSLENDDLATAVKSLIEGEATFVMYDYLFRQGGLNMILLPDMSKSSEEAPPGANESIMEQAPPYIKEGLTFPYVKGVEFIKFIKGREGWAGIDKIYSDLPSSTEQILHPQKYILEDRDYPVAVKLPELKEDLPSNKWQVQLRNVMGEFNVEIILRQFLPTLRTEKIAEGWGGDEFMVWENNDSKQILLAWFVNWDTIRDAKDFFIAYNKLINRKYQELESMKKDPLLRTWKERNKDSFILLERREQDVLIIEGATQELLNTLTDSVWKGTSKELLKEVKRIDPNKKKELEKEKEKGKK